MQTFRIWVRDTPPIFQVEADSEGEARETARQDLHDWADQIEFEVESEKGTES